MTDRPVRLSSEQLDRLIILQKRQLQIAEQRLRLLGVSQREIDAATQQANDNTIPMAEGGTINLEGEQYHLVDHDDTGVTLRKVG